MGSDSSKAYRVQRIYSLAHLLGDGSYGTGLL